MALYKTPKEAGGHANMLALCVFDIEAPFYHDHLDVTGFEECRLAMAGISTGRMGQMLSGVRTVAPGPIVHSFNLAHK